MGFPWAEAIGGAANLGSSALSAYFGWKHQKEVMQNRHQWEVADMRKAGLNRMWSRQGRFDFYWPVLAHLGEQIKSVL